MTKETDSAYWLGVRDARMGHAESHPIWPFTREELQAYRQGYMEQRFTDARKALTK
jgi:hypothetical protein